MPRASASTLSPATASRKRYDWDETTSTWENISKLGLGIFFFAVIYCWYSWCRSPRAPTCPGLEVVLFQHLWARRELLCVCICHGIRVACLHKKVEKIDLLCRSMQCCDAVGMSFPHRWLARKSQIPMLQWSGEQITTTNHFQLEYEVSQ